ncbi:amidohydrolase [Blastopirellula marina]|uniref:Amidohydrolase n=1 Tax=Blastopirellula marina TaxID=124 RepID=A0A2S8FNG0_9BACT|nr:MULTISPECIES: amidohydrolase family protein [Pirellulaceae]PQO33384.1 amidohydrolase [Blastopirellula marina]RCS52473.1 amidohydrolase [Bremerella cremea]
MDLSAIPLLDQHAHNLLKPEAADRKPFRAAFTEGYHSDIIAHHAQHTFFFRRSLREIGQLLACEPTEQAILTRRSQLSLEQLTAQCFTGANMEGILIDDGLLPGDILPLDWHQQFVPVQRLLRIEMLAEDLVTKATSLDNFLAQYRAALDPPPADVVGLKSIIAYRTGLDVQPVSIDNARAKFAVWQADAQNGWPRMVDKKLLDFLLLHALELAAHHQLPVQFHTGFGDPDLDLRLANPLHLRPLLEDHRYRGASFVLLHASYPFAREAGYLASVYPHVYLDLSLAVPYLSVSGMQRTVRELLELAPFTKLMYASDAHQIPELYYLAAKWGRTVLGNALDEAVRDTDLTADEADEVAEAVLHGNARRLYRLNTV